MSFSENEDLAQAYWRWPPRPDTDPEILRTVADFLDGLDDAMVIDRADRKMQEDLRRIADRLEVLTGT